MVPSMFLAHLVGDYILQTNKLAYWKSRSLTGVTVHCLIVFVVTWLFTLPFAGNGWLGWWPGVLFIGGLHYVIDAGQFLLKPRIAPLPRFLLDQIAHFLVITAALVGGGYLQATAVSTHGQRLLQDERLLLFALGYAFLTMPAWVLIKFVAYGLVRGDAPEFGDSSKYVSILERVLMTTFIALGQFVLAPLIVAPRLALEWRNVAEGEQTAVYLAELLVSIALAVCIGLLLSRL